MSLAASEPSAAGDRGRKDIAAALCLAALGFFILNLPAHPDAISPAVFLRLPLEVPFGAFLLLIAPPRAARGLAVVMAVALTLILMLKLADIGTQAAFQRPFNPYLDIKMMLDGWDLLSRATGRAIAIPAVAAALLILLLTGFSVFRSAMRLSRLKAPYRRIGICGFASMALAGTILSALPGGNIPVEAKAGAYLLRRLDLIVTSFADMRRFEQQLAARPPDLNGSGLFRAVKGRDVVVIFIESYGRSAIDDPRYAPAIRPRLAAIDRNLEENGLSAASGWLVSPTVGGLSWLAHASFLSGLWIDNQARYDRLMRSDWPSLNRLFAEAGWQSLAVMPAITMPWPEAKWYGYDRVLAAADLGYRGRPFNWVTMPDQYTLSAFERLARQPAHEEDKPVMAEIVLISSHAPWTPVPQRIAWESIGDGAIFSEQAARGETPAQIWADAGKVRAQYVKSIAYSLDILDDYLNRFAGEGIFILVGDHQPAAIVTGAQASRAVPIHVVSRDRKLIESLRGKGFSAGMLPLVSLPERPMSDMRPLLLGLSAQ